MIATVGHSNWPIDQFIRLLYDQRIGTVWDVRSHPTSTWPQYQLPRLKKELEKHNIVYEWMSGLGGWSKDDAIWEWDMMDKGVDIRPYLRPKLPKDHIAKPHPGPGWTNQGLYDYQWFMTTHRFLSNADLLMLMGGEIRIAIMCAEVLWWKCHRSMISDYLYFQGVESLHLQPKLTLHSQAIGTRLDRYLDVVKKVWEVHRDSKIIR